MRTRRDDGRGQIEHASRHRRARREYGVVRQGVQVAVTHGLRCNFHELHEIARRVGGLGGWWAGAALSGTAAARLVCTIVRVGSQGAALTGAGEASGAGGLSDAVDVMAGLRWYHRAAKDILKKIMPQICQNMAKFP